MSEQAEKTTILNILVAEDNMVNQIVMQGLLEKLGHQVTIAEDGLEAVQSYAYQAKGERFDVILMDINMPNMNGIEACQKIRETDQDIPIIAVTANTLQEQRQKCIEAGMNHFASKPVDKQKLMDLLKDVVEKKSGVSSSSAQTGAPQSEIIYVDKGSLNQLIQDLGKERVRKLLDLYKKDALDLIQNIQLRMDVESCTHTLAGMSENLNFTALGQSARTILTNCKEEKNIGLSTEIRDLSAIYKETMKIAEDMLV